jgi:hypothetical protein
VGEPLRLIEQVTSNENPIGLRTRNRADDVIMARLISIQVKVTEMHRSFPGQRTIPTEDS